MTKLTRRGRRATALAFLATLAIGTATLETGVQAQPPTPIVQHLQHRLDWSTHHIRVLNQRRTYLKHYIRGLRRKLHPAVAATTTSSTSNGTATSSYPSGPLRISPEQAASYMRAAGFPESVIPYFLNTIIPRESGFCPTAVYPGHCGDVSLFHAGGNACSLFQLYTCPGPQAADPAVAARYAYQKYAASGLAPWGG